MAMIIGVVGAWILSLLFVGSLLYAHGERERELAEV